MLDTFITTFVGVEIILLISAISISYSYFFVFKSILQIRQRPLKAFMFFLHLIHEGRPSQKEFSWGVVAKCNCACCLT